MGLGSVSLNMFWNPAIKGSNFLQASMKGIHSYAGKLSSVNILGGTNFNKSKQELRSFYKQAKHLEKVKLLKSTNFPLLNRNLKSLENRLGKIRSQSAKIAANPIKLDISSSRNALADAKRDMSSIEASAKQTAFYSRKNAENLKAGTAVASASAKATKKKSASTGAIMGTALALSPLAMPLREGFKFEQAIADVKAITDPKFEKDIHLLRATALKLGASTEHTMVSVAQGEKYLSMAGFNPKQIQHSMAGVLALATAGDLDLASSADIGSNILTAYGYKASDKLDVKTKDGKNKKVYAMDRVADVLSFAGATSNTNIEEMGEASKYTASVAEGFRGKDAFIETTALIGILANAGLKATNAGTHLKNAYVRLATPTKAALTELDELGVNAFNKDGDTKSLFELKTEVFKRFKREGYSDSRKSKEWKKIAGGTASANKYGVSMIDDKGGFVPIRTVIGQLNKKFKELGYSESQKASALKDIFGMIAMPSMKILMKAGEGKILEYENRIKNDSDGFGKHVQKIKLDTVIGQGKLLSSAFSGLAITMSNELLPPIKSFVGVMTRGITFIQVWAKENPKLSAGIYAVGVALGVATVALMTFGLVSSLAGKGLATLGLKRAKVGLVGVTGATKKATIAQRIFNGVVRMSPFILVATVIAGAVLAFADWNSAVAFGKGAIEGFSTSLKALEPIYQPIISMFTGATKIVTDFANSLGFIGVKSAESSNFGFIFGQALGILVPAMVGAKIASKALGFALSIFGRKSKIATNSVGMLGSTLNNMSFSAKKPINYKIGVRMPSSKKIMGRFGSILMNLARFARANPIVIAATVATYGIKQFADAQHKAIKLSRPASLSSSKAELTDNVDYIEKKLKDMKSGAFSSVGGFTERFMHGSTTPAKIKAQEKLLKVAKRRLAQKNGIVAIPKVSRTSKVIKRSKAEIQRLKNKAFLKVQELNPNFNASKYIKPVKLESPTDLTEQHLKKTKEAGAAQSGKHQSSSSKTVHNTINIDAKHMTKGELSKMIKQISRDEKHHATDIQLQDIH